MNQTNKTKDFELCGLRARMYCESDQASLCWDCDEKVHGANFLVSKYSRSLLYHVCNFPTPWMASGAKLPTVSVCESCVDFHNRKFEQGRVNLICLGLFIPSSRVG
ncbi:hypothetical protein F8388_004282 [Cannabis sativa]|uniref:B box-type domain-containing protein n=1 Tax=Cannabis sativa TaxID=3483 RepID=A0A7J6F7P3_CANSA|nr:hypothetical protein F8388_004282 [Cannabis sativa]